MFGSTGEYSDVTPDSDGTFKVHLKFCHLSKSILQDRSQLLMKFMDEPELHLSSWVKVIQAILRHIFDTQWKRSYMAGADIASD